MKVIEKRTIKSFTFTDVFKYLGKRKFILFTLVYTLAIFLLGAVIYRSGILRPTINAVKNLFSENYVSDLTERFTHTYKDAEKNRIRIDIDFEDYQKLAFQRELALKYGSAYREMDANESVPATIYFQGEEMKAKMKLKGGQPDHWGHEYKWSFKVTLKGDSRIFGMSEFALQRPETRSFLNEWFLHTLLKDNRLIGLRYYFVPLTVNGRDYDIYSIEENMTTALIENNERREGPVFNFDTALMWNNNTGNLRYQSGSPVNFYNLDDESNLPINFENAKNKIELFREGKLTTSQVFDTDMLAKYFAIMDLTGHHHASYLYNIKFYYNPVTTKIEPIGYDNQLIRPISYGKSKVETENEGSLYGQYKQIAQKELEGFNFHKYVFNDPEFYKKYMQALLDVSKKSFLDDFFGKHQAELQDNEDILKLYLKTYSFAGPKNTLYENQVEIGKLLDTSIGVKVYFNGYDTNTDTLSLGVNNISSFPLQINGIEIGKNIKVENINEIVQAISTRSINQESQIIKIKMKNSFKWEDSYKSKIKIKLETYGLKDGITQDVLSYSFVDKSINKSITLQKPNLSSFNDFYIKDKQVILRPRTLALDNKTLIIPEGYTLVLSAGQTIDLKNNSRILSYSPVRFIGTEEEPVVIFSSDSKGKGLAIINAKSISYLNFVELSNLGWFKDDNWELTASITFYQSDVEIHNSEFIKNRDADDFLNVVRSNLTLSNSSFTGTNADALDCDFAKGVITDMKFTNTGNDALDFSGSELKVERVELRNIGDKGISVGENSRVNAKDITGENLNIGIASKDLSVTYIENLNLESVKYGLAAFRKKPEYGPSTIVMLNAPVLKNVEHEYIEETGSEIYIGTKRVKSIPQEKVRSILYNEL